jgi:hypothetical protein
MPGGEKMDKQRGEEGENGKGQDRGKEEEFLPIEKKFVIWTLIIGFILWAVLAFTFGYPFNH